MSTLSENDGGATSEETQNESELGQWLARVPEDFYRNLDPEYHSNYDHAFLQFLERNGWFVGGVRRRVGELQSRINFACAYFFGGAVSGMARRTNKNYFIHSGVFAVGTPEENENNFKQIRSRKDGVTLVAVHVSPKWADHFHILHDCPLSNGSCRCFNGIGIKRRHGGYNYFTEQSKEDVRKIIKYVLCGFGRALCYFKGGNCVYEREISTTLLSVRSSGSGQERNSIEGDLEESYRECDLLLRSGESESEGGLGVLQSTSRVGVSAVKRPAEDFGDTIYRKLKMIMCSPLKEFPRTSIWMKNMWKVKPTSEIVTCAVNRLQYELTHMSLKSYKEMYEKLIEQVGDDACTWSAYDYDKFNEVYLPRDSSLIILKKLLINQYSPTSINPETGDVHTPDWKDDVYSMVEKLIHFLDKRNGKQNTWYIQSPTNAGKTVFTDLLSDYLINPGHMKTWNKTNAFPTEELSGARFAIWNEPNYDPAIEPELLKLLGGDKMSVPVKYEKSATVKGVPLIVTSNNYLFPRKPEFNTRIVFNLWRPTPFLKFLDNKRLHPLSLHDLFDATENHFMKFIR